MQSLINTIVNIILGSFCLIYGVQCMSSALEQSNYKKIQNILIQKMTALRLFIISIVITALIQSSTAVTVMTVSMVNSKMLPFEMSLPIIYGSNIGTTITAQLMSLNISQYGWVLIFPGIFLLFIRKKTLGKVFIGVGCIFLGIQILNRSAVIMNDNAFIKNFLLKYGSSKTICFLLGMVITMLIHSSSATTGLSIVFFNMGLLGLPSALALILGDNIGTCITAQIAAAGANIHAVRTAWAHTLYNIIGVVIAFICLKPFETLVISFTGLLGQGSNMYIANAHTLFNVLSAMVFLPLNNWYAKLITICISERRP